jgi:hypothetical protein
MLFGNEDVPGRVAGIEETALATIDVSWIL